MWLSFLRHARSKVVKSPPPSNSAEKLHQTFSLDEQGRSADAIRSAIIHPEDSQGDAGHSVEVKTASDKTYRGLIRARDNFNLVLQSEDGAFHSIARQDIKHMMTSSQPLMPQDYATRLDNKQIDDLVSYLLKNSGTGKQASAKGNDED